MRFNTSKKLYILTSVLLMFAVFVPVAFAANSLAGTKSPLQQSECPTLQNYNDSLQLNSLLKQARVSIDYMPILVASLADSELVNTILAETTLIVRTADLIPSASTPIEVIPFAPFEPIDIPFAPPDEEIISTHVTSALEPPAIAEFTPLLSSVPLDAELQWQIFTKACGGDKTKFCIAMAMAKRESQFIADQIGDDGKSYGIIQIMFCWHEARLAKFGFTVEDLFDPVKCIIVGLDYLDSLSGYPETFTVSHSALMKYNMGPGRAAELFAEDYTSSNYSREVMSTYEAYMAEFQLPV